MDEENFIWTAPEDVPAEIQIDGQVTETYTGEQVADEAGNPAWWDDNYPGQITDTAANPTQDAYGLNILNAEQTAQLTRNINPAFINNFTDPNAPAPTAAANAVNKNATAVKPGQSNLAGPPDSFIKDANGEWVENPKYAVNTSAAPVSIYVDSNGVAFNPVTGLSYPVNSQGRQLLPADVVLTSEQKLRINLYNHTPTNLAPTAVADPEVGPRTDYRKTVAEAARQNANSEFPNPFLTQIDQAGTNIAKGTAGIAISKENIQTAQQDIVDAESYIAQNNTELANPDISAERRAELAANNAENAQVIFNANQSITNQETYITQTQDNIQLNEASINENAAVYRDTTNPANTTTVDINTDPSISLVDRVRSLFSGQPTRTAAPINTRADGESFGNRYDDGFGGFVNGDGQPVDANGLLIPTGNNVTQGADPVNPIDTGYVSDAEQIAQGRLLQSANDAVADEAAQVEVGRQLAQQQAVNAAQKKISNNGDWRVRLSIAPNADYLYNAPDPGILGPLTRTGGVIFPYTPRIEMSYKADYESYALTHSNYKGYFYKSSSVDPVGMTATFTAQDSAEADYLLAVIHFFRSVTKMFYGRDPQRGTPPPLVYLTGLGQFQFNGHPCVVTSFNYNLPSDVDYIRARSPNINGTNMLTRRNRQDLPTNPISGAVGRLQNLFSGQGISYGAEVCRPPPPTLGLNNPTYVPTKLDISLSLLPVQTRSQVSRQFSLQQYATGALLGGSPGTSGQGGFW